MKPLYILLFMLPVVLFGQSSYIKKEFVKTFENDSLKIGKDTVRTGRNGVEYWLVDIIPQKPGIYYLKHLFINQDDWGYKNNSFLHVLKVAKKGTARFISNTEPVYGYDCWVGDTIVIPIRLDKHITSHSFSAERDAVYGKIHSFITPENKRSLKWYIMSTIPELEFIKIVSSYSVHRGLKNESVNHKVLFQAIKPGHFNISLNEKEYPIIILPKNKSFRKLSTHVLGKMWDDHASSAKNRAYWTEHAILRVGDTIAIDFLNYVQEINKPKKINTTLGVKKTGFKLSKTGYDYWLID